MIITGGASVSLVKIESARIGHPKIEIIDAIARSAATKTWCRAVEFDLRGFQH